MRRPVVLAMLVAGATACGGSSPSPRQPEAQAAKQSGKRRVLEFVTPARVIALPDAAVATLSFRDEDGSRRLIVQGMRLTERVDGSIERARELLPAGRQVRTLELPERFGGGHLFYTTASGSAHVWRAKTWTAELEPLANLDLDVESIVDGFDRLYVSDRRAFEVVALDPRTGKVVDSGALPPSPSYTGMAFADAWLGAVEVPFRGVLVTFDAGSSWRPLPVYPTYGIELVKDEIVVATGMGRYAITRSGVLQQHDARAGGDTLFRGAASGAAPNHEPAKEVPDEPITPAPGPLGRRPLAAAVLHGFPDTGETALVIENGALGRVRLSDGSVVDVAERALLGGGTCHGVRVGSGFGFVCGQERGDTTVYAFEPPLSLRPLLRFDGPRYVAASDNGGLVVRGRCEGKADEASGAYCVRTPQGQLREIRVRGDVGVERVVALSDGRTAVLVPPRLGAPGLLTLVDASGRAVGIKLKLPKAEAPILALLKKGLWLDGFVERKKGELAGWVAAAGPFVGVRIKLDGTVKVGKIENDLDRALLSGQLALVLGRTGLAAETTDGGFTWREVDLPADEAPGSRRTGASVSTERGCSPVGCAFGSWLRVGWRGAKDDKSELVTAEPPPPTPGLPNPGGRWQLTCLPTGEAFGPTEPVAAARRPPPRPRYRPRHGAWGAIAPAPDAVESTDWSPFLGVAPPNKKNADVGLDIGTEYAETQLHGYAWGARGASWDRVGNWLVRAYDRFSLKDAVWSTATTRTPWADMVTAAQVFGQDYGGMGGGWSGVMEPSGRSAVLLVSSRGTVELFLAEEGRSLTALEDVTKWGISQISGAVKLGSTWYFGSMMSGTSFRIFKIDGNRVDLFGEYPLRQGHRGGSSMIASVVRSQRGDALGIWAEARKTRAALTSWYVYPVDLETGASDEPLEITPAALGETPRVCGADADGWLLEGEPPVLPYLDFSGGADAVRARKVEARLLVSAHGACIESLSAQAETNVPERLARGAVSAWTAAGKSSAPLALTDRARGGRRWGFRCVP